MYIRTGMYKRVCIYIYSHIYRYSCIYTEVNCHIHINVSESVRRGVLLSSARISHACTNVVRAICRLRERPSGTPMSS